MQNKEKGLFAENIASAYLVKKGYKILFRNWNCRWGELDLIMQERGILVFIEVKYRITTGYGEIYESLTYFKKRHLFRSINIFLQKEPVFNKNGNWRVDLICIKNEFNRLTIKHYKSLSLT